MVSGVAALPQVRIGRHEADIEGELERLMDEFERSLLFVSRTLLHDADFALDCVQETFLRAYEALCSGRQVNGGWHFKVARSRAVDELRRRGRLRSDSREPVTASADGSAETSLAVREVMGGLSQQHREVLFLFAVAGFKTDEIAGFLGTSGAAVRQRLYRARQEFRRVYGEAHRTC